MVSIAALARLAQSLSLYLAAGIESLRMPHSTAAEDPRLDMDEFVTIATYDKVTDAHIALGRLAAEGIEAQLFDDHLVQMDWLYSIAVGGIKLRVSRGDAKAAREVLETDYSAVLDDVERNGTDD